ncbi:unnamed protein product [Dovyalis caffra]|uniref:Vomeronasal type-1 receptor n=1 Tax=Dovyalis caffra TaxID=77055 RepID=A0AAV1RS09_9ROSI|nr:unnamed protein product [Dovyalis caffra]
MVFNSLIVLSVAHISADAWQQIACLRLQDRVSSHQLLDLVCCFPLQQLGRFALYIWTFLCLPPPDSFMSSYSYQSTSSDDEDHHPHRLYGHRDHASSSSTSIGRERGNMLESWPKLDFDEHRVSYKVFAFPFGIFDSHHFRTSHGEVIK